MGVAALIFLGVAFMQDANAQRQCPSTYDYNVNGRTEFEPNGAYIKSPASIASGPAIPMINAAGPMFVGRPEITIAAPIFVNASSSGVQRQNHRRYRQHGEPRR